MDSDRPRKQHINDTSNDTSLPASHPPVMEQTGIAYQSQRLETLRAR
jgi:hypothetical protein